MSETTRIIFGIEARRQLYVGIETAARAVGSTLGPRGKTVLIQRHEQAPTVTKDGVTVAKAIKLSNPTHQMGAQLILEAAAQTNEVAGDGTTTATILTHAMVKEGLKLLGAGYSAKELCEGINRMQKKVDTQLVAASKQLTTTEEITQIGTISANGDQVIGQLIANAMEKVGKDGIITVEDAKGMSTTLDVAEGMQFERGYLSPYFVTNNDKMNATYTDAFVLVSDKKFSNLRELIPVLEQVVQAQKPLLIIADDVDGEAIQGLVLNRVKSQLPVVAIKAPGYGAHRIDFLKDICVLTGATLVSNSTGVTLDKGVQFLGKVKKLVVDAKSTVLVGTGTTKEVVEKHVEELRSQLVDITLNQEEVFKLKTRIAKLASGVAVIKVGGSTEVEMIELKYRVEDALNATKSAIAEGIVPGGGMALINAVSKCRVNQKQGEDIGGGIVEKACYAPLRRIVENCGISADVVIKELERSEHSSDVGYNASDDTYVNMIKAGIIDPVRVTRAALKNAASVAVTFLNLDAVICDHVETHENDAL